MMCQISTLPFGGDGLSFGYVSKWDNTYGQVVLFKEWQISNSELATIPIVISSPIIETPAWNMAYGMVPSKVQVNSDVYVPTSKLVYQMNKWIPTMVAANMNAAGSFTFDRGTKYGIVLVSPRDQTMTGLIGFFGNNIWQPVTPMPDWISITASGSVMTAAVSRTMWSYFILQHG